MTVKEAAQASGLKILCGGEALAREIKGVYCCDLLSFVMGRAPADSAWITVMGNVNAMAVALLADVACIVLAEGAALDEDAQGKAALNGITVLGSSLPIYETARGIEQAIEL